jgi:lysophospholipase L1-like esterase
MPLLPVMYFQAQKIRKNIPSLPEATGNSGYATPQVNTVPISPINLLILGESTMAGVGVATQQEGFAGALAQTLAKQLNRPIDWRVFAKSGYTAKDINQKIIPEITQEKPDLIVVGLGGNDTFGLHSPQEWATQIRQLIGQLRQIFGQTPILFINMPPVADFPAFTPLIQTVLGNLILLHRQALMQLVKTQKNVYFVDEVITLANWMVAKGQNKAEDFFSDGVHPNQLTYQTWGENIAKYIVEEAKLEF